MEFHQICIIQADVIEHCYLLTNKNYFPFQGVISSAPTARTVQKTAGLYSCMVHDHTQSL